MIRIILADDHIIVRRGLRQILQDEFRHAEIKEVGDAEELMKEIMSSTWDVVISDLSMPGRSGLEALEQIKESFPKLPVLILSMFPEEQYAIRAMKCGASGYLKKDLAPDELVKAVKYALAGKKYITPSVADKLAEEIGRDTDKLPHELLSHREFDVMRAIAAGQSISEIAARLSLGVTTVSTYRTRILEKMKLKTNADITRYVMEHTLA